MKTKDLEIKDYRYYPDVDAFLILADRPGLGTRLPRAVIGWMHRTRPASLICVRSFPDMPAAVELYKNTLAFVNFPDKVLEIKDKQRQKVYNWEDHLLMPAYDRPLTHYADATKILMRVCREMDIPLPILLWQTENQHSKYERSPSTILFGHRSLIPLLHEIAHAMQDLKPGNENNNIHHSPGFVWDVITLYNRYADIDLRILVQSAAKAGILGPCTIEAPQNYIKAVVPKISPQAPTLS